MFGFLKKSQDNGTDGFVAPVTGKCISIEEVADAVFSSKMMGDGFAIVPTGDTVVAPADGEIVMIPESKHAFGMKTKDGVELLVPAPFDRLYPHYLCAMIDGALGEIDRYSGEMSQYNSMLAEFTLWLRRRRPPRPARVKW